MDVNSLSTSTLCSEDAGSKCFPVFSNRHKQGRHGHAQAGLAEEDLLRLHILRRFEDHRDGWWWGQHQIPHRTPHTDPSPPPRHAHTPVGEQSSPVGEQPKHLCS
ncbi:unnamed protein product [Arctogadus glacialis]